MTEPESLWEQALNEAPEEERAEVERIIAELWEKYGKEAPF